MKITVITVAYNSASTIGETMDSVAKQTHTDIEHLVIDGASKDQTVEFAKERATPHTHIVSEPDKGIYDAMNKGLALASGEIVCFLNADDTYEHREVLVNVAHEMQSKGLDALFGDVAFFHSDAPKRIVRRYRSDRFHPRRLAYGLMPAHPALFMRREILLRIGGFRDDYRIAGDFELIARAFRKDDLRYRHIPEVLVRMRTGGVSTSGWRSKILLNREVLRACRENGIRTNLLKVLSKYPVKFLELLRK